RLDDRFRLLTGGSRTALPRQQTLRATLDWSYQLLREPERSLLRRLSVFVAGCTLDAAEAVCRGEDVAAGDVLGLASPPVGAALEWSIERGPAELGLRLAGALGWLWAVRDYWSEGKDWLERALAAPGAEARTASRAKALDQLGINADCLGDLATEGRAYEDC